IESIETALEDVEGPVLRVGLGLRVFFAKAHSDPVWCRFVARVWKVGGFELPFRDIEEGLRLGLFRAPSVGAARDVVLGAVGEALLRVGEGRTPPTYGAEITQLCLQALGIDARRIAAVMAHALPSSGNDEESP